MLFIAYVKVALFQGYGGIKEVLPCPFLCTMWSIFMSRKKYSKAFKLRLLKKHNETGISY